MRNCSTSRTMYRIYYDFTANRMLPWIPINQTMHVIHNFLYTTHYHTPNMLGISISQPRWSCFRYQCWWLQCSWTFRQLSEQVIISPKLCFWFRRRLRRRRRTPTLVQAITLSQITNTPIKFIFAIAIEVADYKNLMIFGINRKSKMASGGHFV